MQNSRVLLLNASYAPIRVISLHRAIMLMVDDKVDIVETRDGIIRSPSISLPHPSVLRLKRFVKVPLSKKNVPVTRRTVLTRDGKRCGYCGTTADTIDHILPKSRGGKHEWLNVVAACRTCNLKKGSKLLTEIGWELKIAPTSPEDRRKWLILGIAEDSWKDYLEYA